MKRVFLFLSVVLMSLFFAFCATSSGGKSVAESSNSQIEDSKIKRKRENLVLFPFTGGNTADGVSIVSSLTRQQVLRDAFEKVTLVTENTSAALSFEQDFQKYSGLTDPDSVFEFARKLKASHVIAGSITRLANQNLVLVSIMDVESLQQIAGDYRTYKTIDEISRLIPEIAKKLAAAVTQDTSNLPGLSVPPFNLSRDINQNDSMVLAQILSCDLANSGRFAVLPRTDSIDKVMQEHERQRSGNLDSERNKRLGLGRNAEYVLSGSVERTGTGSESVTKFTADVLGRADGSFIDGYEEEYSNFSQGLELMPKLAAKLSGVNETGSLTGFVRIEGGTFQMGSSKGYSDEKPIHTVTVKSFSIGKYQVTQKEWTAIMGSNPSSFKGDNRPVESITWYQAVEFCNKVSQKENLSPVYEIRGTNVTWNRNANGYRLPTEAEWEYAAKGGNKDATIYEYSGSNDAGEVAWYSENSGGSSQDVGMQKPNSLGLYDMSGNVWEWCWDWYGPYGSSSQTDPSGASSGSGRVVRGGSWFNNAQHVRSADRSSNTPSYRSNDLGFRLVRP